MYQPYPRASLPSYRYLVNESDLFNFFGTEESIFQYFFYESIRKRGKQAGDLTFFVVKSPNNAFLPGHNNVSFSSNVVNLISGCVNALHADFRSIDILYKLKSVLIVEVEQYSANRFRHYYSSMKFEQFVSKYNISPCE